MTGTAVLLPLTTDLSWPQVAEAVAAMVAAEDFSGIVHQEYSACQRVARRLGYTYEGNTYDGRRAWQRFYGQVSRGLGKLADSGVLVKAPARSNKTPNGRYTSITTYYTPEKWDELASAADRERDERRLERERQDGLARRLVRLGIRPQCGEHGEVRLDADGWEALLEMAETSPLRELPGVP